MLSNIEKIAYKYYQPKEGIFVLESTDSDAECFTPDNIEQAKQRYKILFDECKKSARENRRNNNKNDNYCGCCGDAYVKHKYYKSKHSLQCFMYVNGSFVAEKKVCLRLIIIDQSKHKAPKRFLLKSVIGRYAKKARK